MKKTLMTGLAFFLMTASLAWAATVDVVQKHQHFDQKEMTVKAGDTVVMKNEDTVKHNIVVIDEDGDSDDKGIQRPGQDIPVTFTKPGLYKVRCNIHSTMKLNVTVQ